MNPIGFFFLCWQVIRSSFIPVMNPVTDDFNTIMQSDEFASEYESWLDEVAKLNEENK